MATLRKPPEILERTREKASGPWSLESIYYAGEPYEGRPTRVFAYLAIPYKVSLPPGMVLVHGGSGKAFREWAELWAERGYAAIAMDLAGCGPDGKRMPDGGPGQGEVEKFDAIADGVKQAWTYHAVAAVIRAHSLLRSLDEVEGDLTGITGISWGGYLTCIAAGIDNRFKVAVPVYGCGYLYENSAWLDEFAKLSPENRQAWIENYDPSRYLPRVRMPILFVNGTNDGAYPLDSYQKSYRSVRGPRTLCVTIRMPHGHPEGWAPKEIGLFVDSVINDGEPLARFMSIRQEGRRILATLDTPFHLQSATLNYTTQFGNWQQREWLTIPAQLGKRNETDESIETVRAELPADDGITWFLTVTDDRGATVSSEHETIAKRVSASQPA
jgi:dienelactone hydrolase